jgi:hypothetical protein
MGDVKERPVDSVIRPKAVFGSSLSGLHRSVPHATLARQAAQPVARPGCIDPHAVLRFARRAASGLGRPKSTIVLTGVRLESLTR